MKKKSIRLVRSIICAGALAFTGSACADWLETVEVEKIADEAVLSVKATSGTVAADGASKDTIVAQIATEAGAKTVVFKTNWGRFERSLEPRAAQIIALPVNGTEKREARAVLVADTTMALDSVAVVQVTIGTVQRTLHVRVTKGGAS